MHCDDRHLQRIGWRFGESDDIYNLNTLTYGTASAPYLAMKSLYQFAYDFQSKFPNAFKKVLVIAVITSKFQNFWTFVTKRLTA